MTERMPSVELKGYNLDLKVPRKRSRVVGEAAPGDGRAECRSGGLPWSWGLAGSFRRAFFDLP